MENPKTECFPNTKAYRSLFRGEECLTIQRTLEERLNGFFFPLQTSKALFKSITLKGSWIVLLGDPTQLKQLTAPQSDRVPSRTIG